MVASVSTERLGRRGIVSTGSVR